jgi:hypothetical protein
MLGVSSVAAQLAASQEGLSSIELVRLAMVMTPVKVITSRGNGFWFNGTYLSIL